MFKIWNHENTVTLRTVKVSPIIWMCVFHVFFFTMIYLEGHGSALILMSEMYFQVVLNDA